MAGPGFHGSLQARPDTVRLGYQVLGVPVPILDRYPERRPGDMALQTLTERPGLEVRSQLDASGTRLLGPPGEDAREDAIHPSEKQGSSEPKTDGEQDSGTDQ